jgi:toxin ParE1/3/4
MSALHRRPGVDDDIFDLAAYLLERNETAARRFVDAVQETLKELAGHPGMGSPKQFADAALRDVRSWWVKGFPNYIIYYLPMENGIDVLAVIHGARDVERFLTGRI